MMMMMMIMMMKQRALLSRSSRSSISRSITSHHHHSSITTFSSACSSRSSRNNKLMFQSSSTTINNANNNIKNNLTQQFCSWDCNRNQSPIRRSFSSSSNDDDIIVVKSSTTTTKNNNNRLLPEDGLTLQHFVTTSQQQQHQQEGIINHHVAKKTDRSSNSPPLLLLLFHIKTYGCQMNVNDTDIVRSILLDNGFHETSNEDEANIWLTNTCAIREKAESKVWQRLHRQNKVSKLQQSKKKKKKNNVSSSTSDNNNQQQQQQQRKIVGLLGCMAERLKEDILEKKLANIVVGPDDYRQLPQLLRTELLKNEKEEQDDEDILLATAGLHLNNNNNNNNNTKYETYHDIMPQMATTIHDDGTNTLTTTTTSAFVSIQRGCSNRCSFCIVPFTRGNERSRPLETIIKEVETLLLSNNNSQKIREIVLLGQNVNSYHDQSDSALLARPTSVVNGLSNDGFKNRIKRQTVGGYSFEDLLTHVAAIDPEVRIRFTSPHPKDYPIDLLHLMAETPNICNQLHMPAQSGSSSMLQRMKRGYTRDAYIELIDTAKSIIPNVAISSDFISGFCGETQSEHLDTLSLLEYVEYEQAYLFAYSMREQTYASRKYHDDVPPNIKQERLQQLIDTFRHSVRIKNERIEIGKLRLVLLEGPAKKQKKDMMDNNNNNNTTNNNEIIIWQGRTDQNKRIFFHYRPVVEDDIATKLLAVVKEDGGVDAKTTSSLLNTTMSNTASSYPEAGEYAVVQVTEVKGHTLRGEMLWKTTLSNFAKFESNTLAKMTMDDNHDRIIENFHKAASSSIY